MAEKYLMKGNEALAEAAIKAGCRNFYGYPITPQTEVAAYMAKKMPKIGGVFLQAESEVAAINMVLGAGSAGSRVMTSSSSPGISLKSEGISYLAGSDVPCVIINVQRGGPGLGGIQPSQADYWQATKATGHGDFQILVFAPATIQEMCDLVSKAFDLGDYYRMPCMILADGLLGQMMEPVELSGEEVDPENLPKKTWATNGHENKRKHNVVNSLYLKPDQLEANVIERFKRYDVIKEKEVMFDGYMVDDADVVIVAYGASARISKSAVNMLREQGIKCGLLRPITLWPFPTKEIEKVASKVKKLVSVELSMGQMVDDVKLAANGKCPVEFYGRTGGMLPTPKEIVDFITKSMGGTK